MLPPPPQLGPPSSYVAAKWLTAPDDEPFMYWDEIDRDRWSIRCVRKYRSGALEAYSYASENWRDVMPEAAMPPLAEINGHPECEAVAIAAPEFEAVWRQAIAFRNSPSS
jgi:hypothetical protein